MDFAHPFLLLLFVPFVLLFFFFKKLERKRYLDIPTTGIVQKIGITKRFAKKSGPVLWTLSVLFLVFTIAGPLGTVFQREMFVEGRVMIVSIDLSTSMSGTALSKTGRPSVDVIKELALKFVQKRATTDLVGITAYAGRSMGRDNGEAAVILLPTSEFVQLEASIKFLKPYMLGAFTSIGEGIFVSVLSCIPSQTRKKISIPKLIRSLDSEDRIYAIDVVKKIGRFDNRVIVLFTDGKNNAGIEPQKALWLANKLGIKVHFAALESTGPTGLSLVQEETQRRILIRGVEETGGRYAEMNMVENVEDFFNEVDRLETSRLEFGERMIREECFRTPLLALTLVLIFSAFVLENVFPRIQP